MKFLFVATISNTINAFMLPHINMLRSQGHTVDIACRVIDNIKLDDCLVYNIPLERSPIRSNNISAYKKLKKIINNGKYDIIHTHTPIASVVTRLANINGSAQLYYTAHGFHFYKGAPLKNWLVYFPLEKFLARFTDVIITINNEDYIRAKKSFGDKAKIEYIPGVGFDLNQFKNKSEGKTVSKKELGIKEDAFVILSVGELNENKNHQVLIKAISHLNNENIVYLICGDGNISERLKLLANELGIKEQVKFLGYRSDVASIALLADVFAFPSKREGLGMAAIEAMASNLPIITSNVHGIVDYSIDGVTGFNYNPNDALGFSNGIKILMEKPDLKARFAKNSRESIGKFRKEIVLKKLHEIYLNNR